MVLWEMTLTGNVWTQYRDGKYYGTAMPGYETRPATLYGLSPNDTIVKNGVIYQEGAGIVAAREAAAVAQAAEAARVAARAAEIQAYKDNQARLLSNMQGSVATGEIRSSTTSVVGIDAMKAAEIKAATPTTTPTPTPTTTTPSILTAPFSSIPTFTSVAPAPIKVPLAPTYIAPTPAPKTTFTSTPIIAPTSPSILTSPISSIPTSTSTAPAPIKVPLAPVTAPQPTVYPTIVTSTPLAPTPSLTLGGVASAAPNDTLITSGAFGTKPTVLVQAPTTQPSSLFSDPRYQTPLFSTYKSPMPSYVPIVSSNQTSIYTPTPLSPSGRVAYLSNQYDKAVANLDPYSVSQVSNINQMVGQIKAEVRQEEVKNTLSIYKAESWYDSLSTSKKALVLGTASNINFGVADSYLSSKLNNNDYQYESTLQYKKNIYDTLDVGGQTQGIDRLKSGIEKVGTGSGMQMVATSLLFGGVVGAVAKGAVALGASPALVSGATVWSGRAITGYVGYDVASTALAGQRGSAALEGGLFVAALPIVGAGALLGGNAMSAGLAASPKLDLFKPSTINPDYKFDSYLTRDEITTSVRGKESPFSLFRKDVNPTNPDFKYDNTVSRDEVVNSVRGKESSFSPFRTDAKTVNPSYNYDNILSRDELVSSVRGNNKNSLSLFSENEVNPVNPSYKNEPFLTRDEVETSIRGKQTGLFRQPDISTKIPEFSYLPKTAQKELLKRETTRSIKGKNPYSEADTLIFDRNAKVSLSSGWQVTKTEQRYKPIVSDTKPEYAEDLVNMNRRSQEATNVKPIVETDVRKSYKVLTGYSYDVKPPVPKNQPFLVVYPSPLIKQKEVIQTPQSMDYAIPSTLIASKVRKDLTDDKTTIPIIQTLKRGQVQEQDQLSKLFTGQTLKLAGITANKQLINNDIGLRLTERTTTQQQQKPRTISQVLNSQSMLYFQKTNQNTIPKQRYDQGTKTGIKPQIPQTPQPYFDKKPVIPPILGGGGGESGGFGFAAPQGERKKGKWNPWYAASLENVTKTELSGAGVGGARHIKSRPTTQRYAKEWRLGGRSIPTMQQITGKGKSKKSRGLFL